MPQLFLVSHRLPVTVASTEDGGFEIHPSTGGLASALSGPHERGSTWWVGYPGETNNRRGSRKKALDDELAKRRLVPVPLPPAQLNAYYDGFANGVLWPLFHYLVDKVKLDASREFEAYRDVNERFAEVVLDLLEEGDTVWVHDYQLMLLPAMLRAKTKNVRIGFFLHIPFPSSEVFRTLPWREEILRGLLGADLVGFQTASDRRAFARAASQVLGTDYENDAVLLGERRVALGVHPIAIDHEMFSALGRSPEVVEKAAKIRADAAGRVIVLGVDRLDYTKGIEQRLLAVERLLERRPDLRERLRYIQIAIPTREHVPAYARLRRQVDELVGRINGKLGSHESVPIHLLHRSVDRKELVALYRAADVMTVTPLRDGMNLVAKEFVASRTDGDGALVLSEFAGAAAELTEAMKVNPFDVEGMSVAIERAIESDARERELRMSWLRERVARNDADHFCSRFLAELEASATSHASSATGRELHARIADAVDAPQRVLFLDYDGTLVPFARVPALAVPDEALLDLLTRLARADATSVHLVSGRHRDELARWFGDLPIWLHAEHGLATRNPGEAAFTTRLVSPTDWIAPATQVMHDYARWLPGSHVEPKPTSIAFHYREADLDLCAKLLPNLERGLTKVLPAGAELLHGSRVLEARSADAHKGNIVAEVLANVDPRAAIVAAGDDVTDEDLFAALPRDAISIHVGPGPSRASHHVAAPEELRAILEPLTRTAETRGGATSWISPSSTTARSATGG